MVAVLDEHRRATGHRVGDRLDGGVVRRQRDLAAAVGVLHLHDAGELGDRRLTLRGTGLEQLGDTGQTLGDVGRRGDAAGVERTQRQLGARLADGLGRDDADGLADVHQLVGVVGFCGKHGSGEVVSAEGHVDDLRAEREVQRAVKLLIRDFSADVDVQATCEQDGTGPCQGGIVSGSHRHRFVFHRESVVAVGCGQLKVGHVDVPYGDGVCARHGEREVLQQYGELAVGLLFGRHRGLHGRCADAIHRHHEVVRVVFGRGEHCAQGHANAK